MPRRRKGSSRPAPIEEEEMLDEEPMDDEEDCEDGGRGGDDEDEEDDFSEGSGGRGKGGRERPGQRNAANARERARMRVLSRAFCRLKTTLPWVPPDTKLSKLDTLRLATSYIAHLRAMLSADEDSDGGAAETIVPRKGAAPQRRTKGAESPDRGKMPVPSNPLHPLNLTWPFSFQRSASSLPSSSPASSTSSSSTPSGANGPTGISHMNEWTTAPDEAPSHYCQGNHIAMEHMNNHQTRVSSPMHHNLIHHHHPHHFIPSSYPDSSLLHMA